MYDQRNKHRRGIEEEIAQKGPYPSHKEGSQRVKNNCGRADNHIVQVHVSAGHRNREYAHA